MTDLSSLIERIEKSEGADRVVDGLIWAFLKGDDPYIIGNKPGPFPQKPIYGTRADVMRELPNADGADYIGAPPFSSSIDAAMTLVPEGWHWTLYDTNGFDGPDRKAVAQLEPENYDTARLMEGQAATPALALCAATLRARMEVPNA